MDSEAGSSGELFSHHHGIKLEGDGGGRREQPLSAGGRDCRSSSSGTCGVANEPHPAPGGGLLPVIRERLLPLPPLPGFPPLDSAPPPPSGTSVMSTTGGGKPPLPPMDLLMPTLAPIQPSSPARSPSRSTPPVPIFALNAKGSYYVPMSVDLAVIAPFMALYTEETYSVLHPVTISVNFQVS